MRKSTKSLWIYAAILFIIAIGLITLATVMQARLITSDGEIEVLGTFTKNTRQNIENLTNENINLTNKLNDLTDKYNILKTDFENVSNEEAKQSRHTEIMRQMYVAYEDNDYKALEDLFALIEKDALITAQEADEHIPGLYEEAQKALEANNKNTASRR